jgi:2-keto-4-pentenoate hydratase/2-oxohepta-3-ene-1,7-dioic acid hydratase in catechol pathway
VSAGRIYDVNRALVDRGATDLFGLLRNWASVEAMIEELRMTLTSGADGAPLEDVSLRAPLLPGTIYCAGANYVDHIAEMAQVMKQPVPPSAKVLGEDPWFFIKARSAVVGPNATVALPRDSQRVDYEVELAVVIGTAANNVSVASALDHVAGYTIGNDLSVREVGRPRTPVGSPFHFDWISMKNFDGACPLGPWIVPRRYVQDPQHLSLELWVNGEARQTSNTDQMIFSVAEQIAWLSTRVTLHPGDVILTGTPAGVGMATGRFLRRGDLVRVRVEKLGEMSITIA